MQFWQGGQQPPVPIRWYRADDEAAPITWATPFRSRDWNPEDRGASLGETTDPRGYDQGFDFLGYPGRVVRPPPPPPTRVLDNFASPNAVKLETHKPEIGGAWRNEGTVPFFVEKGRIFPQSAFFSAYATIEAGTDVLDLNCTSDRAGGPFFTLEDQGGALFRWQDKDNYWRFRFNRSIGSMGLELIFNGGLVRVAYGRGLPPPVRSARVRFQIEVRPGRATLSWAVPGPSGPRAEGSVTLEGDELAGATRVGLWSGGIPPKADVPGFFGPFVVVSKAPIPFFPPTPRPCGSEEIWLRGGFPGIDPPLQVRADGSAPCCEGRRGEVQISWVGDAEGPAPPPPDQAGQVGEKEGPAGAQIGPPPGVVQAGQVGEKEGPAGAQAGPALVSARVTQEVVEVVRAVAFAGRVTQEVLEVVGLRVPPPVVQAGRAGEKEGPAGVQVRGFHQAGRAGEKEGPAGVQVRGFHQAGRAGEKEGPAGVQGSLTGAVVTQEVAELVAAGSPPGRVTQDVLEILAAGSPTGRLTQDVLEIVTPQDYAVLAYHYTGVADPITATSPGYAAHNDIITYNVPVTMNILLEANFLAYVTGATPRYVGAYLYLDSTQELGGWLEYLPSGTGWQTFTVMVPLLSVPPGSHNFSLLFAVQTSGDTLNVAYRTIKITQVP
jgi:hypothetical protein